MWLDWLMAGVLVGLPVGAIAQALGEAIRREKEASK